MTTMAAIDRVVHHSVILDMMSAESYRAEAATLQQIREQAEGEQKSAEMVATGGS
ncbi:MAG TPA: hypothetical protein VFU49_20015 [Ktedonobacteraceae bacterium]|nr:hypothetical protein [Ktedonobacteraceae bacterium]